MAIPVRNGNLSPPLTGPRSYSCLLHPSVAATKGGPSGGGTAVLLAPLDVRPWLAEAKDDRHGIGYSGIQEDRVGEMKGKARSTGVHGLFGQVGPNYTGSHSHVHARTHTHTHAHTLRYLLQAFGVGALEEEDDDIYSSERMTDYHSSALAEEEGEEKFGWTGPHATGEPHTGDEGSEALPCTCVLCRGLVAVHCLQPAEEDAASSEGTDCPARCCHLLVLVMEWSTASLGVGVGRADLCLYSSPPPPQAYPPPALPKDFKPVHKATTETGVCVCACV